MDIHTNPAMLDNDTALVCLLARNPCSTIHRLLTIVTQAAGYLEGLMSAARIEQYGINMQIDQYQPSKKCRLRHIPIH